MEGNAWLVLSGWVSGGVGLLFVKTGKVVVSHVEETVARVEGQPLCALLQQVFCLFQQVDAMRARCHVLDRELVAAQNYLFYLEGGLGQSAYLLCGAGLLGAPSQAQRGHSIINKYAPQTSRSYPGPQLAPPFLPAH